MSPAVIKFATLENVDIEITSEDAKHIALESKTFARILSGELQEDVFEVPKFGGEAINLAVKYCKKFGEIQHSCTPCSESFEIKCKEIQPWVDDFIVHITEGGLGMVHELLAVSFGLETSRLFGLTCQCIFDELCFKDYWKFREAFAFQFLFPPHYSHHRDIQKVEAVLDGLECSTLEEILTEFKDKIPFTPDELELAKSENKSVRVSGNLKYKTKCRSVEDLLTKIEYIQRRLNSFGLFSIWMDGSRTLSQCYTDYNAHFEKVFDDQSNNGIGRICYAIPVTADSMYDLFFTRYEGLVDQSTNHKNIDVIRDEMDKTEFVLARKANTHKKEVEEIVKRHLEIWKSCHGDKIFPCLTFFLENCYQEIHRAFCSLRGWMSPHEVRHKISMLENMEDEKEGQGMDVESEVQPFVSQKTIVDDELKELEGNELEELTIDVVSSVRKLKYLALSTLYGPGIERETFCNWQIDMRKLLHFELEMKDEEILVFICKRKFKFYMEASERGRSTLSFADDKEEFDRIMKETDEKFGDRGPAVEEAKKKYSLYYNKFHHALVDETKRQKLLLDAYADKGKPAS